MGAIRVIRPPKEIYIMAKQLGATEAQKGSITITSDDELLALNTACIKTLAGGETELDFNGVHVKTQMFDGTLRLVGTDGQPTFKRIPVDRNALPALVVETSSGTLRVITTFHDKWEHPTDSYNSYFVSGMADSQGRKPQESLGLFNPEGIKLHRTILGKEWGLNKYGRKVAIEAGA
jgi:hypothetical protein